MVRAGIAGAVAGVCLSWAPWPATGAKAQEPATDEAFFPLRQGCTWVYATRHKTENEKFDMTVRIEGPWTENSTTGTVMTQEDPRGRMREFLVRQERGFFIQKIAVKKFLVPEVTTRFDPPMPRLFFPMQPGSKLHWEGHLKIAWIDKQIVFDGTVVGWEDIDVPAGRFHCLRLHFIEKRGDEDVTEDVWYAPGVGQVQYNGGHYIKALKSFQKP